MLSLKMILTQPKYFASVWVFASLNILIGTWVLYIPYVKEKLSLSDSELGFAMFSFALGILIFLPVIPFITKKIGVGNYTLIGIILFSISFTLPLMASNYIGLCISLFICGIFSGSTDVAMNALVSEFEKLDSVNFMSAAHGFFSLGGVIGGIVGSVLISVLIDPVWHMILIASIIIFSNIILAKRYRLIKEEILVANDVKFQIKKFKPLISLAIIAISIMMCEGAVEHWSNLYLIEVVNVSSLSLAGLGFIVFSTTMTLGRFFGDKISYNIGSTKTILYGCILGIFGYVFILVDSFTIAIFGFGVLGMGLSVIIPELFRVAGKTKGISSSASISFVSGIGFIGFLIGPVLLGLIADSYNLKVSFSMLLILVVIALIISSIRLRKGN